MNIIIVGCGQVGKTLAEELNREVNEVTMIDIDYSRVEEMSNRYDIMGVVGNGVSYSTQIEAGIEKADLLIAVTDSDELNIMSCLMAKRAGNCQTIARVRDPEIAEEMKYLKDSLGLALTINPEYAVAHEIARILRFPSAISIDVFGKGAVELLRFRVPQDSKLHDMQIMDIGPKLGADVLVCGVESGDNIVIPNGNFRLSQNDLVSIVARPRASSEFFKKIGIDTHQVKDAMIVGGGNTSYHLARLLLRLGINIKLIEEDEDRCEFLAENLPKADIIHGSATDQELLIEEGIADTQAFVSLSEQDEENIILSLFAKKQTKGKIVTKVEGAELAGIIKDLNLDTTIYPKRLTAQYIIQFVRAMNRSKDCNVETMYRLFDDRVEALEFGVLEGSELIGIPLMNLKIKENTLVACIIRGSRIIIPRGRDTMQIGDSVVIVTTTLGLKDINDVISKDNR